MKNKFLAIILFILLFFSVAQAQEVALTLDQAIAIGLRDNREVLMRAEEVKKAKAKIDQANAALFPSLTFTGGYTNTHGLSPKNLGLTTTQTSVRQALFQGGRIINTILYTRDGLEVSRAVLDKAKLETAFNISKAFYTLLLARESAALNKGILENTRMHLDYLLARQKNGQASDSEILNIKDSLANVEKAYEAAVNQAESAQVLLKSILYLDEKISLLPQAEFKYEPQDIAYDESLIKAMSTRPEIRQYEAQIKANQKAIEIAKADSRPQIYGSWEYYSRSSYSAIASGGTITGASSGSGKGWNDYSTLGFVFTWPVFDGWAAKAKVDQAITDLKQARLLKEKTVKDVASEVKNTYLELKTALSRLKAAETGLLNYRNSLSVATAQKQSGIASTLDWDDAKLRYDVADFNKKQAVYDYLIAKANFDKATGGV